MVNPYLQLFLKLYILGKKIQALAKSHNSDMLLQGAILMFLASHSMSITELSEKFGIKLSAMSNRMSLMEQNGLIEHIKGKDSRTKISCITPLGLKSLADFTTTFNEKCHPHQFNLTKTQINVLLKMLNLLKLEDL